VRALGRHLAEALAERAGCDRHRRDRAWILKFRGFYGHRGEEGHAARDRSTSSTRR